MTPWILRLIIANFIMFILTTVSPILMTELTFVPVQILSRPWTLITYMFLHVGFSHIFFNMLSLFFFGPRLELELGGRRFLQLYFVSGVTGGLLSFLFSPFTAIVGASGAVYGVMLGYAYLWPRSLIYIWGILPVEARWLVVGMTVLSIYGGFGPTSGGIAHFAHLGGFLGGYLYLKLFYQRVTATRYQAPAGYPEAKPGDIERWSRIPRDSLHAVNREELDRILDKLKVSGVSSLTPAEREFLERFSTQ